jgi:hypothetical protein
MATSLIILISVISLFGLSTFTAMAVTAEYRKTFWPFRPWVLVVQMTCLFLTVIGFIMLICRLDEIQQREEGTLQYEKVDTPLYKIKQ